MKRSDVLYGVAIGTCVLVVVATGMLSSKVENKSATCSSLSGVYADEKEVDYNEESYEKFKESERTIYEKGTGKTIEDINGEAISIEELNSRYKEVWYEEPDDIDKHW